MIVVLDTNIYISDPGLSSQRLEVLEEYARKTMSSFAMPRIVLEELLAKRRRAIEDAATKARSALRQLKNHLLLADVLDIEVSVDAEIQAYKTKVFERFLYEDEMVAEYGKGYLDEVMRRAVNRIPPCSPKGEEIRDAVLWLTILDIARIDEERTVLFISEDRSAFAEKDDLLKPELLAECVAAGVTVRYFSSLKGFAEALAVRLDFISEQWIESSIPIDKIVESAKEFIEESADVMLARELKTGERHKDTTGYFNQVSHDVTLDYFFVNELADSKLRIEVVYRGEVEVECELSGEREVEGLPGRWVYSAILDDMEFEPGEPRTWERFSEMEYVYPDITIVVEILVENQKIVSWEIIDLDC